MGATDDVTDREKTWRNLGSAGSCRRSKSPTTLSERISYSPTSYEALTTQLQLQGAVAIQPLTAEQVNTYLKKGGKKLAAVQRLLREEPTFPELLDTPLRYAAFLDYAADCLFLRKVGGGYMFIHRMLLDYFASLGNAGEGEKPSASPPAS